MPKASKTYERQTVASRAFVNASPVDRTEFQSLASLVRSLKGESCRHLKLETETQTEVEVLHAQMASTRKGLGKIAELVQDDLAALRADLTLEMQALQVDCIRRVDELTATVERLAFRFSRHIQDCQKMGDQVDHLTEQLSETNIHAHQFEADVAHKHEQMTLRLTAHDHIAVRVTELAKAHAVDMEAVEARMIRLVAAMKDHVQDAMTATEARWDVYETTKVRHDTIMHSIIHDMIQLRDQVGNVTVLYHHVEQVVSQAQERTSSMETQVTALESTTHQAIQAVEDDIEKHLKAVMETVELAMRLFHDRTMNSNQTG